MISSIRGEVLSAGVGWVVVAVGGLGFRVEVPARVAGAHVGDYVDLHTQLVVREDSLTLFGFSTLEDLEVFGVLLGFRSGAQERAGVLSVLAPFEIAQAVTNEDEKPFRKVSGIGPKTAKLILVQLAGKLQHIHLSERGQSEGTDGIASSAVGAARVAANVEQGLLGLGYPEPQAHAAVQDAMSAGAPSDEAGLLRAALLLLQSPRAGSRAGSRTEGAR